MLLFSFQCNLTNKCKNNSCFWKQRDCFGRRYWLSVDPKAEKEQEEIRKKCGEPIYPNLIVSPVMDSISVMCKDYK